MFGITKTQSLKSKNSSFLENYCGTCKAIGKSYGHTLRMTLNYDIVFLSELYEVIIPKSKQESKRQAFHCFNLPKTEEEIRFNHKYASACNILLSELKIKDNIKDGFFPIWKFA